MKKEYIIKFAFLSVLFVGVISCMRSEKMNSECINLNIEAAKVDEILLSQYYNDFEIIPLMLNKDMQIADIDDIVLSNNRIFVLDRKSTKSISIFSDSGDFISRIRNLGRGPGEYINLPDFDIDQKKGELYLLDWDGKKVCVFGINGNHLRDIRLGNSFSGISHLDSSIYLTNSVYGNTAALIEYNTSTMSENVLLDNNDIYRSNMLILRKNGSMFKYEDKVLLAFPHSSIIYEIREGKVKPYFKIISDAFESLLQEINTGEESLSLEKQMALPLISNYSENKELATFQLSLNHKQYFCFYSFLNDDFFASEEIIDDILTIKPVLLKLQKGSLLTYIDPYQVYMLGEKLRKGEITLESELEKEILRQSSDYNYPILIRYYEK